MKVGDSVFYKGKPITTIASIEPHGINMRVTYANGYSVVVPRSMVEQ